MIRLEPLRLDREALALYVSFFSLVYPRSRHFSVDYLNWLYCQNTDGMPFGFNAWENGQLVAHYACIPSRVKVNGHTVKAMLSLNTATHPAFQGRGLFTQLANSTYEMAAAQGVDAVYGVANANSTPGFVKKLGFQKVRPLDACVGFGNLGVDWSARAKNTCFERVWDAASLRWRLGNPQKRLHAHVNRSCSAFWAPGPGWGVQAYAELDLPFFFDETPQRMLERCAPRLFLGLYPTGTWSKHRYVEIPERWRPSPLNLIYRPLGSLPSEIDGHAVSFSFLDFDAY